MKTKILRNVLLIVVVIAAAWFTFPRSTTRDAEGVRRVEAAEFMQTIQDSAVVVIDVRTPEEHQEGFIPGTDYNINVKSGDFEQQVVKRVPAQAVVAVYCRSGNRSQKAADILSKKGYRVIELSTGYKGWKAYTEK